MHLCNRIYYSKVYWRLHMFRAANRSSSGALNRICNLWFIYPCGGRPLTRQRQLTSSPCNRRWVPKARVYHITGAVSALYQLRTYLKNLGITSKFSVPEGWHATLFILRTYKYWAHLYGIWSRLLYRMLSPVDSVSTLHLYVPGINVPTETGCPDAVVLLLLYKRVIMNLAMTGFFCAN
jgi:hypothetical protein